MASLSSGTSILLPKCHIKKVSMAECCIIPRECCYEN